MKLYEIPKGSRINAEVRNESGKIADYLIFHHLDGMYSYCTAGDTKEVCHLGVSQELKLNNDGTYSLI